MIRFKSSIYQFYQVQDSKLEEFVMERFYIFNYINFDSLKFFLENNLKKEVTCEKLVNNFLNDSEKQENVLETLKDVITNLSGDCINNGSTYHVNLQNVFWNKNGKMIFKKDVSIKENAIVSEETFKNIKEYIENSMVNLQKEINSLKDSIKKDYLIKSNNFNVDEDGVKVNIEVIQKEIDQKDLKQMLNYIVEILLPFINDENVKEKIKNKWWNTDDKNSKIIYADIDQAKPNKKNNFQNELSNKISESLSIPISNSDIVYHWALMFAYGDLNEMRKSIPWQHLKEISTHAKVLIEDYKKQSNLMKHSFNNLTVTVASLIIEQIEEITKGKNENINVSRRISIECVKKFFKFK